MSLKPVSRLTRREFLLRGGAVAALTSCTATRLFALSGGQGTRQGRSSPIRIAVPQTSELNASMRNGLQLGREEAERTVSLLGGKLQVGALDPTRLVRSAEPFDAQASTAARAANRTLFDVILVRDPILDAAALDAGPPVVAFATDQAVPRSSWSVRAAGEARIATAVRLLAARAGARRWGLLVDVDVRDVNAGALLTAMRTHAETLVFARGTRVPVSTGDVDQVDALAVAGGNASAPDLRQRLGTTASVRTWLVRLPMESSFDEPALAAQEACVTEWHHSLTRFGASELNERYERRFSGARMDGDAWAAWLAVRIAADSTLRARSISESTLVESSIASGRFDGHKGVALTFGGPNGQHRLTQPLYVVARSDPASEPVLWEE